MQKTLTILYKEFKQNLVALVNNSSLPSCVVAETMRSVLMELDQASNRIYNDDLARMQLNIVNEKAISPQPNDEEVTQEPISDEFPDVEPEQVEPT